MRPEGGKQERKRQVVLKERKGANWSGENEGSKWKKGKRQRRSKIEKVEGRQERRESQGQRHRSGRKKRGRLEERRDGAKGGENRSGERPEREGTSRETSKRREKGCEPWGGSQRAGVGGKEGEIQGDLRGRGGETEEERKGWRGCGKKMRRE